MVIKKSKEDKYILGFRDCKKVHDVSNVMLLLVITATIENYLGSRILINDGSSCNIMYPDIFRKLGLCEWDLRSYKGGNLLTFNDSSTH